MGEIVESAVAWWRLPRRWSPRRALPVLLIATLANTTVLGAEGDAEAAAQERARELAAPRLVASTPECFCARAARAT